ncbi:MAG: hypothetical protein ACE5KQ_00955 [Thermoplasmata archaeon]
MASPQPLTWQLTVSAFLAITGILLLAAAFSPDSPAPFPAIFGSGLLALAGAVIFFRKHFVYLRGREPE